MNNDRKLVLSFGTSRKSTNWVRTEIMWSEFVDRLKSPQRTPESSKDFMAMSKAQQSLLKDVGGFVGGSLSGKQRKAAAVMGRDLITLDMDNLAAGETQNVLKKINSLGAASAVYSTRSHAEFRPRLRVIMPLDRTVTADEYEPIARKLAEIIGIEMCDPTTFEASRLMYWPSCSKDSQYVFLATDAPFVSADGVLQQYADWHAINSWPQVPGEAVKAKAVLAKQADPTTKDGLVGAFCRTYDIFSAIEKFLPHAYEPTDSEDRLTYTGGSTIGGAVIYDNGNFLYSHHATDPCSGELVNAFDLIRLHRFSDQDQTAKPGTPISKLPSYQAMKRLAFADKAVAKSLNETMAKASDVFQPVPGQTSATDTPDVNWLEAAQLVYDQNTGLPKSSRDNIIRILNFDPALKDKIATDEFAVRGLVLGSLPWDARPEKRNWSDTDDAGLAWYLEQRWNISGRDKIDNSLMLVSDQHRINEVKDYLSKLVWDNIPRLNTVLTDYLGVEGDRYTEAVARKSLTAAVARVMEPGIKYDYTPVLVGPQGIGKSTFLATLGKDWYSDSLQSFEGKEAAEMIQGIWINELSEMTSYNRSEINTIKQFLSKKDDIYRQAYGRRTDRYPRKCVFFGSCNKYDFLKDDTGNRRFWPVDCGVHEPLKSIWNDLPKEIDQIWAEAVVRYRMGEPLYFEGELDELAKSRQDEHKENNAKEGMILDFVAAGVPEKYSTMSLSARRMFWAGQMESSGTLMPRDRVCALEVWCELFNGDPKFMRRTDSQEINQILSNISGWHRTKTVKKFGYCGAQRGFENSNF